MTSNHPFPEDIRRIAKNWFDNPVVTGRNAFRDLQWSPAPYLSRLKAPPHVLSRWQELAQPITKRDPEKQRIANDLYKANRKCAANLPPIPHSHKVTLYPRWMNDPFDNFVWVKDQNPIAEKICADLAFLLDLPVAPVRLWEIPNTQANSAYANIYFSAALLAFPDVDWPKAPSAFEDPFLPAVYDFDWWVDNRDRKGTDMCAPKNPETSRQKGIVYFDWGLCFGQITYRDLCPRSESIRSRDKFHSRNLGGPNQQRKLNYETVIERIAGFSDDMLREVLSHIPDELYSYHPKLYNNSELSKDYDYKQIIMEHLQQGRDVIREDLRTHDRSSDVPIVT